MFCLKVFQDIYVDVTTVGCLVRIKMLYIIENIDLNQEAFNFNTNYHVISDHGPLGGYLQMLPNEIRGVKYHSIKIIRKPNGLDLEEALAFSKNHMLNLFAIFKRLDFKTMMLFFLLRFKPLKQTIKERLLV